MWGGNGRRDPLIPVMTQQRFIECSSDPRQFAKEMLLHPVGSSAWIRLGRLYAMGCLIRGLELEKANELVEVLIQLDPSRAVGLRAAQRRAQTSQD